MKLPEPMRSRKGRAVSRGRPPKFGRPSAVVALTLPHDVLDHLRTLHRDPGWAIVQLVESLVGGERSASKAAIELAELVHLPGGRALIVVEPRAFKRLRGVSMIPLADGRAFLAFDQGASLADLEVAICDRLEETTNRSQEREELTQLRDLVRGWRRNREITFRTKSIIVAEGYYGKRAPLSRLRGAKEIRNQS
jgi:hypothetical protein